MTQSQSYRVNIQYIGLFKKKKKKKRQHSYILTLEQPYSNILPLFPSVSLFQLHDFAPLRLKKITRNGISERKEGILQILLARTIQTSWPGNDRTGTKTYRWDSVYCAPRYDGSARTNKATGAQTPGWSLAQTVIYFCQTFQGYVSQKFILLEQ